MTIEIIVPVYNAPAALQGALEALFATLTDGHPVQIVDDASTQPAVRPILERWRNHPGVVLRRQSRNLGFVRTVNGAMAATTRDVVLLNSDTVVTPGWLQRIAACADSDARIGTITPWSNNAEICSLPRFCVANPPPRDAARVARVIAGAGSPEYPDLPTAVGFCMYIRRAALDEQGDFDAETFGRGYGEENDFCRRIAAAGWRNVLCDDAYVVHLGGRSFAETGLKPGGENLRRLVARWPDYEALVAEFIERDPLAPRREALCDALASAGAA